MFRLFGFFQKVKTVTSGEPATSLLTNITSTNLDNLTNIKNKEIVLSKSKSKHRFELNINLLLFLFCKKKKL